MAWTTGANVGGSFGNALTQGGLPSWYASGPSGSGQGNFFSGTGGGGGNTQTDNPGSINYDPTNTQNPLGSVNYSQNYVTADGGTVKATGNPTDPKYFGQTYLRPGLNQALSNLNQGVGFNPYTGQRVANFTDQQNQYFGQVGQQFGQNPGYLQSAQNAINNVTASGGRAPGVQQGLDQLGGIASGQNAINTGGQYQTAANNPLNDLQAGAGQFYQNAQNGFGPSYSEQNLAGVAGGEAFGGDPYFKRALDAQLQDIQNRVNSSFSGSGRYGSGANTDVLAKQLGDTAASALSQNYQFEAGRQLQANQLLDAQRQQDIANRFTGAAGAANVGQNAFQNRLAALQGLTGTQQQNIANQANAATAGGQLSLSAQQDALRAAALAPGQQQAQIDRLNQLLSSGTIQQSQAQDQLNAARDLYNEQQQAPWDRLNAYNNAIGQPQSGSVLPQQNQSSGPSTAQGILGGALAGATIGSKIGGGYGGLGAIAGGLLGGLF